MYGCSNDNLLIDHPALYINYDIGEPLVGGSFKHLHKREQNEKQNKKNKQMDMPRKQEYTRETTNKLNDNFKYEIMILKRWCGPKLIG